MQDGELEARLAVAMPWVRDFRRTRRYFGLAMDEAARVTIRHVDLRPGVSAQGRGPEGGRDEEAYGGAIGWRLVQRLVRQARARDKTTSSPGLALSTPGMCEWVAKFRTARGAPQERPQIVGNIGQGCRHREASALPRRARRVHHPGGARHEVVTDDPRSRAPSRQSTTDRYIDIAQNETAKAVEKAMRLGRPKLRLVRGGRR